jgi:hypothetical protein
MHPDELKERASRLINKIDIEENKREELLSELQKNGLTCELLEEIGQIIDANMAFFESKAEKESLRVQEEIEAIQKEYKKNSQEVISRQKETVKEANRKGEAEQLESLRKKINLSVKGHL